MEQPVSDSGAWMRFQHLTRPKRKASKRVIPQRIRVRESRRDAGKLSNLPAETYAYFSTETYPLSRMKTHRQSPQQMTRYILYTDYLPDELRSQIG
jgi:hypothetical protein